MNKEYFKDIYANLTDGLYNYCMKCGVKSLVLGISGGIDSTLTAVIAHSVATRLNVELIGVSLPSNTNDSAENNAAIAVGTAFCNKFKVSDINDVYLKLLSQVNEIADVSESTKVANGNIKARLRMITLYHIASSTGGIVLDTDNMTEHFCGFYTIHGDDGDIGVLRDLDKTTIFEFADWMCENQGMFTEEQRNAIAMSRALNPTDGNGVGCDLEQFGLPTYKEVDDVVNGINTENTGNVLTLHKKTWYKRLQRPLYIGVDGELYDSQNNEIRFPIDDNECVCLSKVNRIL